MAKVRRMTKKRLGELLVDEGLITDDQVQEALAEQKKTKELLGEVLVRKSYVTEQDIARTLATQFSLPFISARKYNVPKEVADLVPDEMLEKYQFVPIDQFADVLTIVVSGVVDTAALEEIEKLTGCTVKVCVGTATDVREVRERFKGEAAKGSARPAAAAPAAAAAVPLAKAPAEIEEPKEEDVAELIAAMSHESGGEAAAAPVEAEVVEEVMEEVAEPELEVAPPPAKEAPPAEEEEPPPKKAVRKVTPKAVPKKAAVKAKPTDTEDGGKSGKPAWTRKVTRRVRKKA